MSERRERRQAGRSDHLGGSNAFWARFFSTAENICAQKPR